MFHNVQLRIATRTTRGQYVARGDLASIRGWTPLSGVWPTEPTKVTLSNQGAVERPLMPLIEFDPVIQINEGDILGTYQDGIVVEAQRRFWINPVSGRYITVPDDGSPLLFQVWHEKTTSQATVFRPSTHVHPLLSEGHVFLCVHVYQSDFGHMINWRTRYRVMLGGHEPLEKDMLHPAITQYISYIPHLVHQWNPLDRQYSIKIW